MRDARDYGIRVMGEHPPGAILGPVPCQACRVLVWWAKGRTRVDGKTVAGLAFWRTVGGNIHRHSGPTQRPGSRPRVPAKLAHHRYPQLANARAEWDNRLAGSSSQSNRLPDGARDSATTRGTGVIASSEVVAR